MAIGLNTNDVPSVLDLVETRLRAIGHALDRIFDGPRRLEPGQLVAVGQTDCEYCDGDGFVERDRPGYSGIAWERVEVECTDCFGHGKELCQHCGERPSEFRFNYRVGSQKLGSDFICGGCATLPIYGGAS